MASQRVHLTLPGAIRDEPVIATLAQRFDLELNIGRAHIEGDSGWVIVDMDGSDEERLRAFEWLRGKGVHVEPIELEGG